MYKDPDSDYGVHFLSLRVLYGSGETLQEALLDAKQSAEESLLWSNEEDIPDETDASFVGIFPVEVEIELSHEKSVDK